MTNMIKEWEKMQKEVKRKVEQDMTQAEAYEEVKKERVFGKEN